MKCNICANHCKIAIDSYGICGQYKNVDGEIVNCSYGIVSSISPDPIEKKPLYHFLPGTQTFSIGGIGCNMKCLHCQNYMISQNYDMLNNLIKITPELVVENAISSDCKSIAYTYNEPTIHLPFYNKVSKLAKEKNIKIIYVSNGYFSKESLNKILPFSDAFNIDLKSINNDFYKKVCKVEIEPVLENLKAIYGAGKHLEITNLLINDYNDSNEEINKLVNFILEELGPEVPLHFSRSFPYYKMDDIIPTYEKTLIEFRKIAISKGMEYVYLGNMESDNNSYCPNCGELLVKRDGYLTHSLINDNKCPNCLYKLNFVF